MSTWVLLAFLHPFPWQTLGFYPTQSDCEEALDLLTRDRNSLEFVCVYQEGPGID
jgi:hypothetical protein